MDTTITYLKKEYTLRTAENIVHGKTVRKIMINPISGLSIGYVWKDDARGSGVWLNTHGSFKFPLTKDDLYILNEVMSRFSYYWNKFS